MRPGGEPPGTGFVAELAALLAFGRSADAVGRFRAGIGVLSEMVGAEIPGLQPVAHTLVHDCEISNATTYDLLRSVHTSTLVLGSRSSTDDLVAALPDGRGPRLPGQWRGVPDDVLSPVGTEFFHARPESA